MRFNLRTSQGETNWIRSLINFRFTVPRDSLQKMQSMVRMGTRTFSLMKGVVVSIYRAIFTGVTARYYIFQGRYRADYVQCILRLCNHDISGRIVTAEIMSELKEIVAGMDVPAVRANAGCRASSRISTTSLLKRSGSVCDTASVLTIMLAGWMRLR